MGNIVRITASATSKSLVLLDELGTNTDPAEGSALARAILLYFLSHGTMAVITTHYSDLKAFAHTTPRLQNASLDFDPVTLAPTYHITVGVPGGSNALATAARLGLSSDIIATARGMLTKGTQELERLLADLVIEKKKAEVLQAELAREKAEAERRKTELQNEMERFKGEEKKLAREARDEITRSVAELHREIREAMSDLRKERTKEQVERARKAIGSVKEKLEQQPWASQAESEPSIESKIEVGDIVWLKEVNLPASVIALSQEKREVEVQAGRTKLTLGFDSIEKTSKPAAQTVAEPPA